MRTLAVIGSAAGGVETLRTSLVEPAMARGWRVAVTLTPTAGTWLDAAGEIERIAEVTGLPCRVRPRLPSEPKPHPPIDCYLVCPASANTVAKLALGLSDNQALTTACEGIGDAAVPVVVCPNANAAHAGHPMWLAHLDTLRGAGVHVLDGDEYWSSCAPGSVPERELPRGAILDVVERCTPGEAPAG